MRRVIVDADACPRACLQILQKHKEERGYRLLTVSSIDHQIDNPDHILVGKGPDAADFAVINHSKSGDLIVTQDWGLAALALAKGAFALAPSGRIFKGENMDFLLEERAAKARFRRGGGRTRGPRARTQADNRRFESNLLKLLAQSQWKAK